MSCTRSAADVRVLVHRELAQQLWGELDLAFAPPGSSADYQVSRGMGASAASYPTARCRCARGGGPGTGTGVM